MDLLGGVGVENYNEIIDYLRKNEGYLVRYFEDGSKISYRTTLKNTEEYYDLETGKKIPVSKISMFFPEKPDLGSLDNEMLKYLKGGHYFGD